MPGRKSSSRQTSPNNETNLMPHELEENPLVDLQMDAQTNWEAPPVCPLGFMRIISRHVYRARQVA